MDERIGTILILIKQRDEVQRLNSIISDYADIIVGRQGIRMRDKSTSVISLVIEGTTDKIGGLTGQLGRLKGIEVKSLVLKQS